MDSIRDNHGGLKRSGTLNLVWWEESLRVFEQGSDMINANLRRIQLVGQV